MNPVRKKILIIDDDATFLSQLKDLLGNFYDVQICSSPADKLTSIASSAPDCLMLDLNMPKFDGRTYLPWLRSQFPEVPIVICTGEDDVNIVKFAEFRIASLIRKPVTLNQLILTIESACRHNPLRKAA